MSEYVVSRGEYDNNVEDTQSRVDETLQSLQPDIDKCNRETAELVKQGDGAKVVEYINKSVHELNSQWEFANHNFLVSGRAYLPKVEILPDDNNGHTIKTQTYKDEIHTCATSAGFAPMNVPDEQGNVTAEIGMMFVLDEASFGTYPGNFTFVPKIYASPSEVALSYIRPRNSEIVSSDLAECITTIDELSQNFLDQISDDSSEFYGMSLEEQQGFFKTYIDGMDATLPDPQAGDYLAMREAVSPMFYVMGPDSEGNAALYGFKNGADGAQPELINGAVIGFCVPDEIANRGQVRYGNRSELTASSSGLCAMVAPFKGSNLYLAEEVQDGDMIVPLKDLEGVNYTLI